MRKMALQGGGLVFLALGNPHAGTGTVLDRLAGLERPIEPPVEIRLQLEPVRAAAFFSYRQAGWGTITVHSLAGRASPEGLTLRLELPGRRDLLPEPFEARVPPLAAGEAVEIVARARFSPRILAEPTSEILVRAAVGRGGRDLAAREALVPLADRSVVTWDLPERAAALVDPEAVAGLASAAAASVPPASPSDRNLKLAESVFGGLAALGLRYFEDAPHPAAEALLGRPADRVSLPAETLRRGAGDCDDLSVLLASALEALGVPSALALTEDHLFVLFDLGLPAEGAAGAPVEPEDVLERGARRWAAVEATRLARPGSTLRDALSDARPRLKRLRSPAAHVVDVRLAWAEFPAVGAMVGGGF